MRFLDQIVWITGASSGIGEGLALKFHQEGATIAISGRRTGELERVKDACTEGPGKVLVVPFDIVDESARSEAAKQVLGECGRVDVLVNNAGVGQRALAKDTLLDVDRQLMELDYFAPIALTKLVLPQMIERKSGTLVVTSSVAGKYGVPLRSAYCAAKHALHGYFDTLRIEVLKYNIDVSLLVIAGVTSEVSYKALTADGSPFGDFDYGQDQGISPLDCAQTVLDGLINKDEEIVVGKGRPIEALWLKRYAPETITERFSRIPLPDDAS